MAPKPGHSPQEIPTYTIDLSCPPHKRYDELARDFGPTMRSLTALFNEIMLFTFRFSAIRWGVTQAAKLLLRRVYDDEETEEVKGIAKASGVKLYLVVALNNLLDCMLGCTSGAVLVKPDGAKSTSEPRLMHFRTLDWGMDELRKLLVVQEFINSEKSGNKVLARVITYAGFVGALTGVRENLSISLNFRPNHLCSALSLRRHQLLVVLGRQKSLGSILRTAMLEKATGGPGAGDSQEDLQDQAKRISVLTTAPCYIVLCNGKEATVIEKDLHDGKLRSSDSFLVHTNHDVELPGTSNAEDYAKGSLLGHDEWLLDSNERFDCVRRKWAGHVKRAEAKARREGEAAVPDLGIRPATLKGWLRASPTMNECTHFGCIMDSRDGKISWLQRGTEPIPEKTIEENRTRSL
ncbi:beta subunit of N-acylethanolamine-hydrolyzing acid amidase-domain-containing protein [Xylariales sp. PMI_506]|nr:beta subunit of N-acylethanolamine-hydrolyzing acid amidase-domain-containing protein [Xylariales sp. PMI_506]